jgi:hypothetical protein
MPTVASVAARIQREGDLVTFTRQTDAGPISATVKAFVRGYAPHELVGDIQQGDRVLRVAPGDLAAQGWSDAPDMPDRVQIGDQTAVVQTTETRSLRGVPCMHVIQVRGG